MDLILLHGMGRTPLSMLILARRLKRRGFPCHLFGYLPTFESLEDVTNRLARLIDQRIGNAPYGLIGHSLGSVIIRNTLARLPDNPPAACFFLAPPMVACRAAKFFAPSGLYRMLMGEMGQLLAQDEFMDNLPMRHNTTIYAGTGGPRRKWLPFRDELNDGILTVDEARGKTTGARLVMVPATHTFVMNLRAVAEDIAAIVAR